MQQQKISDNTVTVHCNKLNFFDSCTLQIVPLFPVTYLSTSGRFCTITTQLKSQNSTFFLCFHFFLYSPLGYRQMCWLAPPSGLLLSRFEQWREVYISERVCWVSYQMWFPGFSARELMCQVNQIPQPTSAQLSPLPPTTDMFLVWRMMLGQQLRCCGRIIEIAQTSPSKTSAWGKEGALAQRPDHPFIQRIGRVWTMKSI